MSEERLKASLGSFLSTGPQLEEVPPTRHRPIGKRQVLDVKPKTQEAPKTGDKNIEGEHTVPAPTQETTNMQTSQQTESFKFVPGAPSFSGPPSEEQVKAYAEQQAAAWQAQYAAEQSRQQFVNDLKNKLAADGIAFRVIDDADLPLEVKNKHFAAMGVAPRAPRGMRMTTTAVQTAVIVSAVAVSVIIIGTVVYYFMSNGDVHAMPTEGAPAVG